jgi:branched-chain amino acid transport system ATP-binding protein
MLSVKNVSAFYGNIQALHNVNIEINEGEIITLIGANGAGKSTTLMSICGVTAPRQGKITFMGQEITGLETSEIVSRGIIQVPEGRHIFPYLSVQENLDMGAFNRNDKEDIERDLDYIFEIFPILAQRKNQLGGTLSGGEQQMLAISRGLMSKPKLLLLDEPSLGLAPLLVVQIFDIIKKINQEHKTTIFLVEQNAHMALKIAQRGYVMETGRIKLSDQCSKLAENREVQEAYLGI